MPKEDGIPLGRSTFEMTLIYDVQLADDGAILWLCKSWVRDDWKPDETLTNNDSIYSLRDMSEPTINYTSAAVKVVKLGYSRPKMTVNLAGRP